MFGAVRAARIATSCLARSCWMHCASTGAGSSTSRRPGCFPADADAPRTARSTPRLSGWPADMPPNEPVWSTGTSIRTRCATALPLTCSKAELTCVLSRCCWDTAISKRPPSTCTSSASIWRNRKPTRHAAPRSTRRSDTQRIDRPPLEMADIVRYAGQGFIERSRRWITWQHQKVLLAITRCRTAALGGHRDRCSACGHTTAISYNSCRNRHCPRCQANARVRWLQARAQELLPTRYVHLVFTLPRQLAPLALQNKRVVYNLLFQTSAATLLEFARH